MQIGKPQGAGLAFIVAAGFLSGAASPVLKDRSLAPLAPSPWASQPAAAHTVVATNAMYTAAPMPNPDASGPVDVNRPETTLGPKFISPRSLFQGDGYSNASSEEASLDGRRRAAAGVGLSVPLTDK